MIHATWRLVHSSFRETRRFPGRISRKGAGVGGCPVTVICSTALRMPDRFKASGPREQISPGLGVELCEPALDDRQVLELGGCELRRPGDCGQWVALDARRRSDGGQA